MTGPTHPPIVLNRADLRGLIPLRLATEAVRLAHRDWGANPGLNVLCQRMKSHSGARLCVHQGAAPSLDAIGLFAHSELLSIDRRETHDAAGAPISIVYDEKTSLLAAILVGEPTSEELPDSTAIAGLRTTATSVIGTLELARGDSTTVGLIGAGAQAELHLLALSLEISIDRVLVFSPTTRRRTDFARRMEDRVVASVRPVDSAEEAVISADIIITATNSSTPVIEGSWLRPGQHVTSIVGGVVGLHAPLPGLGGRAELGPDTDDRADLIVLASCEQARYGFELPAFNDLGSGVSRVEAYPHWQKTVEIADVLANRHPGRTTDTQITVYKNNAGQGIADMAIAGLAVRIARESGIGISVEI